MATRKDEIDLLKGELEKVNADLKSIFDNAVEGIFRTTPQGNYLMANPSLAKIYGFSCQEELLDCFSDIKNQLYVNPCRRDDFIREITQKGVVQGFESEVHCKDGRIIWISENARVVYDETGQLKYYEGTVVDITRRKQAELALEEQRAYFQQLFDNSPMAIVLINISGQIININDAFEYLFGYSSNEINGLYNRTILVPNDLLHEIEFMRKIIMDGKSVVKETKRRHKQGHLLDVSVLGYPAKINGQINGIFYCYRDISERKQYEEQLNHQALHDSLTGLPNRSLFRERLDRAIARYKRSKAGYYFSVIMIDIDKFKNINDSLGHQYGDQLLIQISQRLVNCIRSMDTVARLGGDEFAVILEELSHPRDVIEIVMRMKKLMEKPFDIFNHQIISGASFGVVLKNRHRQDQGQDVDHILRDADIAMYCAKKLGQGCFKVFNKKMHSQIIERMEIENDLRQALQNKELELYYQPIVSLSNNYLEGFESLLRWNHPRYGIISPNKFIPIAEETGLIVSIGKWVIAEACHQVKQWENNFDSQHCLTISVNISCKQLKDPYFVEYVEGILNQYQIKPYQLKLEITESIVMIDVKSSKEILMKLKQLGVIIMIDDFGTGYSSLKYLHEFPVDYLKIDRSFISGRSSKDGNWEIVKTILDLARNLGLKVVAEGVEKQTQLMQLQQYECDEVQGFLFSKPLNCDDANILIQSYL